MIHALDDMGTVAIAVILGVGVIIAIAAFARRLGIATPILLVLTGIGLSYLPGVPEIEIPPEFVLDFLLPPILYAAAIRLPFVDFRRNLGTIVSLSVVLVVVTAFGTGFLLYALTPTTVLLPLGIALGAVISPPDVVSATAIGRRLGLPPRLLAVLEGEGLVNDATALVLFGAATAAATEPQRVSALGVGAEFLLAVGVAVAVGLVVGAIGVWVRSRLDDPVLSTAVSLTVPFLAFFPTLVVGGSGVLAVVVAGLYTGHRNPEAFSPAIRISDRVNWSTIQFLLENAVFLLIGLQIRTLIADVRPSDDLTVLDAFGLGLLASLILILLRFLWVGPLVLLIRLREQRAERSTLRALLALQAATRGAGRLRGAALTRARRRYARRRADLDQMRAQVIDWRGGVILGWSGMRGVVTLAAAQALPTEGDFYRPQLVLIAFTVAVVTLVLQGTTLPALIRAIRIDGVDEAEDRRMLAEMLEELSYAGMAVLNDPGDVVEGVREVDPEILERVRQSSFLRAESAWERSRGRDLPLEETPHRLYRRLRLAVVRAERERLLELRSRGTYPPRIEAEAQALLDLEETRLRPAAAAE